MRREPKSNNHGWRYEKKCLQMKWNNWQLVHFIEWTHAPSCSHLIFEEKEDQFRNLLHLVVGSFTTCLTLNNNNLIMIAESSRFHAIRCTNIEEWIDVRRSKITSTSQWTNMNVNKPIDDDFVFFFLFISNQSRIKPWYWLDKVLFIWRAHQGHDNLLLSQRYDYCLN